MKRQRFRTFVAFGIALPLAIVALGLFAQTLIRYYGFFQELQAIFRSESAMLLGCLSIWCGTFLFLTFSRRDWPLLTLLLVALAGYAIGHTESSRVMDAVILLAGVTLGSGTRFALKADRRWKIEDSENGKISGFQPSTFNLQPFLIGLVVLLAFAAWWHLEPAGAYHGPRWMGLWDNPNIYGMLMGAGVVLAIGLLALKSKMEDGRWKMENKKQKAEKRKPLWFVTAIKSAIRNPLSAILVLAIGILGVGLVMSYSRGAWLATTIAFLYLAWCYGKLKWRYVAIGAGCVALGVGLVWGSTLDSAPWYVKRADLGRPSAQNRVIAWRAGLEIMRDHPLGVGWNKAVSLYGEKYRPPEGGPAALTMNSYLMLGTELGIPALACFVAYVGLCFKSPRFKVQSPNSVAEREDDNRESAQESAREDTRPTTVDIGLGTLDATKVACRAGALVFVVAFWFDGGLFNLPTAAMFWVLLELGAYRAPKVHSGELIVDSPLKSA